MSARVSHRDSNGNPILWVTGKGTHRHTNYECGNQRRSVFTGDMTVAPAGDERPMCEHCTPADMLAATPAPAPKPIDPGLCDGGKVLGVKSMKWARPVGTCPTCGKEVVASKKGATFGMAPRHKRA